MQLKEALAEAVQQLEDAAIGSSRLNAEMLLMFVLGVGRAYLYGHPERELTLQEEDSYLETIAERARGVPAQYIIGHQEFWGLDFLVTPAVLIPRPETEHVVEAALELAQGIERPRIVDVGTGSGCIALALAHELSRAEIDAVDISIEALEIAKANAVRLQLADRVNFRVGNLLEGFDTPEFDLVVSNPPYVGECEADKVQAEVRKFEPHVAVFGGPLGTEIVTRLLEQAHRALKPGGHLLVEIGFSQSEKVREMAKAFDDVRFVEDLQGIPRVLVGEKPVISD
jgi:release factor glutamine methyltransferase